MKQDHVAQWWHTNGDKAECTLCPWECSLNESQWGLCGVRMVEQGSLMAVTYGYPAAMAVDPIEKKPLYHFHPGSRIFSIGTFGCNLFCSFCQNWDLSQKKQGDGLTYYSPEQIVAMAIQENCPSIAFTYNEPTIFSEYVIDIARLAKKEGLHTVMVSNGYVLPDARSDIYQFIDAANIDLKAFSNSFYKSLTKGKLEFVLDTLKYLHSTDTHLEITSLLIENENTDQDELKQEFEWIVENLSDIVPLHLSAFYPNYKLIDKNPTHLDILLQSKKIAEEIGIKYVYIGNVRGIDNNTYCLNCGKVIIDRDAYSAKQIYKTKCICGTNTNIIN